VTRGILLIGRIATVVLVAFVALVTSSRPQVSAQTAIRVLGADVENRFPEGLAFRLSAQSDADITGLRLKYTVAPDGVSALGQPTFDKGKQVNVTFDLKSGDRNYFPPGAEITWSWEIQDDSGSTFETERKTFVYEDKRFNWETIQEGNLILKYYTGGEARAREMLRSGRAAIDRMSKIQGVEVQFPVKVYIYASQKDGQPARTQQSQRFNEQVETGGVRVASDTVLIFESNTREVVDSILPHELAHVVTKVSGEGPFGDVPAWLNEGLSVYAQRSPGTGYEQALDLAVRRDRVLSLPSISSSPGDPSLVNLFYGQSGNVVKYLIDTYGEAKMAEFLRTFKNGARTDDATRAVYGVDLAGLENGWRQSVGLKPRTASNSNDNSSQANPVPTIAPIGSQGGQTTINVTIPEQGGGTQSGSSDGVPIVTLIAIGMLLLVLIGGVAGGVLLFVRRYR
jgi:hypothetical protein